MTRSPSLAVKTLVDSASGRNPREPAGRPQLSRPGRRLPLFRLYYCSGQRAQVQTMVTLAASLRPAGRQYETGMGMFGFGTLGRKASSY